MILLNLFIFFKITFGASCTMDTITNNCALLRNLAPTSALLFPDGHLMPACALSSISVNDKMEKVIAADAKIQDILAASQPPFSDIELEKITDKRTLYESLFNPGTLQLWPPVGSTQNRIAVTAEMMKDFWFPRLGTLGTQKLASAVLDRLRAEAPPENTSNAAPPEFSMTGQRERATLLFNESKRLVINNVLNGRSRAALSPPELEVLARVEQTSLNLGSFFSDVISCGDRTASLDNDIGEVEIPPDMMLLPNQTIMRSLIHEISHTFDMCLLSTVGGRSNGGIIRENRVLNHTGYRIVDPRVHPYAEVFNCLKSTTGGNFKGPPAENGEACVDGKANEAFCDWNAAHILGANPKSLNLRTPYGSPRPIGNAYSEIVNAPAGFDVITGLSDFACEDTENRSIEHPSLSHPHGRERVNNILLREPGIRQRFGNCTGSYPPACPISVAIPGSSNLEAEESVR